ncbi:hypothetical protein N7466_005274 [Penicillium verhagenii]|uniref:uncharacterized protein n=1 Tax=Penicillium verhagenii TaxID=1562060 RepID=UPI0025453ED8|nr:uncharacterized protein N7466_005274 [Penicillium verhagenii]KAJ5935727.1 hypothetical protein N7466_005274 [Penicillium verhagenii]
MSSFYTEKAGFDQSHHDVLSLSRSMRSMNHQDLGDHSSCMSPTEADGKMRTSQRRRVPVACRRCRKRKIKCSGDAGGDGQGCSNCRSAGANDCQFFRPYPHMSAATTQSPQLGMIPQNPPSKPNILSMESPHTRMGAFPYPLQRTSDFDISVADAQMFEQPINYTQASSYAPSGALMDYGPAPWSPKAWESMFNTGRTPNGSLYPDPEANMSQSPFAYMLPSQGISLDLPSANSAASVIPSADNALGPDRTLPTPTSRGPQVPSSTAFLPDGGYASDFKGSLWSPRQTGSPDQRPSSTHTIPSNAPFTGSPPLQSKYVGINSTTPEMLFPYLPMPTTAEDTTSAAAPSTINGNPVYPVLELDSEYPPIPTTRLGRSSSRDHGASQQRLASECSSDMYGYSTAGRGKTRGSGTLVSGLPYTRVQHRDTPGTAFPFNLNLGSESLSEYPRSVIENVHRPPVEPLGNQGY